ncbi:hypothetical protein GGQ68_003183 [Sagittula marina]|uniref:Uncharacterized protein n=2 Tax=Sagittula marina TaxID=943940 RepID=A0A7W6GUZ6_9RHOB|nr:hypothetical protein [Sagittula marina]
MKQILAMTIIMLSLGLPSTAAADCYVAYKAKKQPPLELHFGILSLPGTCPDKGTAATQTANRIASGGWTLLNVVSFKDGPPSAGEQANAGTYYLRY